MPGQCRRTFVIGVDGARAEAVREADTPNMDAVFDGGVVSYSARTVMPSISFPAWSSMFHGVGPEKHQIDERHPADEDAPWPSFMKLAKQERRETRCASFSCWEPVNTHIIEPSCECHLVSMPDPELVAAAAEHIRSSTPDVYFMQLDAVDGAGHSHGYRSQEYLDQVTATDAHVGIVLDAIRDAGVFDESLIIVLSDHGGEGKTHGSDHPDCMTTFWGCCGRGIARGVVLDSSVSIMDTAAMVAEALGLPAPDGWDAKVPRGVFGQ